jgi:hypothetical protein
MGESIDLFCQGFEGEMFDRAGTPWPESDVPTIKRIMRPNALHSAHQQATLLL